MVLSLGKSKKSTEARSGECGGWVPTGMWCSARY